MPSEQVSPEITPLTLTFDYFGAGPGRGGTSRLIVKLTNGGRLVAIDDIPTEAPSYSRRKSFKMGSDWRSIVDYLTKNEISAFYTDSDVSGEFAWPYRMRQEGPKNFATELIAMAWSGEPVTEIANVLSSRPDTELLALRSRVGSLVSRRFIYSLLKLKHLCDDLGVPFLEVIQRWHHIRFELRLAMKDARALARVFNQEMRANALRRNWQLLPFQDSIDRAVTTWRGNNPARSTNERIGVGIKSGTLKEYLESYALKNDRLPVGVDVLTNKQHRLSFNVDFDQLIRASIKSS